MTRHKQLALTVACLALTACEKPETTKSRGDARIAIFRECMELAGKMPRQADDDVSDIVTQCSNQSYWLTTYIK